MCALIKLTAVVDNISGKLNGTVFARNKGGHYMRSKSNPVNPQTDFQMNVRGDFGAMATAWRALTQAQRNAWDAAAADFPYQNKLGDTKILSGFNLFMKLNQNLETANVDIDFGRTVTPLGVAQPTNVELQISAQVPGDPPQPSILRVTVQRTSSLYKTTMLIYATPQFSAGIKNFKNKLRLIQVVPVVGSIGPVIENVTTAWEDRYGALTHGGGKIGIAVRFINEISGEGSVQVSESAIVQEL